MTSISIATVLVRGCAGILPIHAVMTVYADLQYVDANDQRKILRTWVRAI
jgi:hypothetical protein